MIKTRCTTEPRTTTDYSLFKYGKWNRPLSERHVIELVESIKKRGVLEAHKTITLTRNYEVFDGQHRLEAFKRLKLPVTYIVDYQATIEDCGFLNSSVKKWDIKNYVNAYIGKEDSNSGSYLTIRDLSKKYPCINIMAIAIISTDPKNLLDTISNKRIQDSIYNGSFEIKEPIGNIETELTFITKCLDEIIKPIGRQINSKITKPKGCQLWTNALHYLFQAGNVDKKLFFNKLINNLSLLFLPGNVETALEQFERIYNYRSKNKADIVHDYKQRIRLNSLSCLKKGEKQ